MNFDKLYNKLLEDFNTSESSSDTSINDALEQQGVRAIFTQLVTLYNSKDKQVAERLYDIITGPESSEEKIKKVSEYRDQVAPMSSFGGIAKEHEDIFSAFRPIFLYGRKGALDQLPKDLPSSESGGFDNIINALKSFQAQLTSKQEASKIQHAKSIDTPENWEKLEKLMKTHDWTYQYSDDHRYWRKGTQERDAIVALANPLSKVDKERVEALYKKYRD